MSRLISQFFCNLNSSKNFICPTGKLITEFTSPIAKSTSPGLSDTAFFARCLYVLVNQSWENFQLDHLADLFHAPLQLFQVLDDDR